MIKVDSLAIWCLIRTRLAAWLTIGKSLFSNQQEPRTPTVENSLITKIKDRPGLIAKKVLFFKTGENLKN